jgi:hypothetical protein
VNNGQNSQRGKAEFRASIEELLSPAWSCITIFKHELQYSLIERPPSEIMKLQTGLFFPALVGAASAFSDASVYILQGKEWSKSSISPPTLTPEQARLVFAQRLGVSQYHDLADAGKDTLSYINEFGANGASLFRASLGDKAAELLVVVEGASADAAKSVLNAWLSTKPAFTISTPPPMKANKNLVQDLNQQAGEAANDCGIQSAINPFDSSCWSGKSKAIHLHLNNDAVSSHIR